MTQKPRLLERPRRTLTESKPAYLLRLAQANYLSGLPELAKIVGMPPSKLIAMTDESLAQFLRGIDKESLALPVTRPTPALELVNRRRWNRCRICPLCIRQKKSSPMYFDFCLSFRCEEHQLFLLDQCSACGAGFTYLRNRLFHCNCGQALANLPQVKVDCAVDLFESQFAPWRDTNEWFCDDATVIQREIAVARAFRALLDICTVKDSSNRRSQAWLRSGDWPIIKSTISPWPHALSDHVKASMSLNNPRFSQLLKYLELSAIPAFIRLRERLIDHRKQESRSFSLNGQPMVSLSSVRYFAKLDAAATQELFDSGIFTIKGTSDGPRGTSYWIGKTEAEQLASWFENTVDLNQAAKIIGCPPSSVRGLTRINRLKATYLPTKPRSPRFFRSTIDAFIKAIESRVLDNTRNSESLIALADLPAAAPRCKYWNAGWGMLIERILAGSIPIFRLGNNRGWAGIGIDPIDLKTRNIKIPWRSDVSAQASSPS